LHNQRHQNRKDRTFAYASPFRIFGGRGILIAGATLLLSAGGSHLYAQYDKVLARGSDSVRTPIGGPASSPLISTEPYDAPDFRPTGLLNDQLPKWLQFGLDERLRFEGYDGGGFIPICHRTCHSEERSDEESGWGKAWIYQPPPRSLAALGMTTLLYD
jgi:hypothetical protein